MLRIKELHDELIEKNKRLDEAHTKIKETHEELTHAAKMVALGEFTAGAAHEINNPLGIASGNAQYILRTLQGKRYVEINEKIFHEILSCLRTVVKQCDRCGDITKNLLRFGHKEKLHKKPTAINKIIDKAFILMKHQLNLANIRVVKKLDSKLPFISIDVSQFETVFVNLILNASVAMPNGGEIKVRTDKGKKRVNIELTDTGCGIPKEIINRIFEPFFTTREIGAGTGLGLSVVHSIIKDHHGEIGVKSKVGKGTTFAIKLPIE